MARALRTRSKIVASTLGVIALGVAVLAPTASASTSDGRFLIHAWNTDDPTIEAYAGIKGLNPGTPGGGTAPAPSVTLADYSCGPMALKITDSMVKFAQGNQDLQAAGKTDELKTNSEGWQGLYSFNSATSPNVQPGFPSDGSKPSQVFLTTDLSTPDRNASVPLNARAYAKSYPTNCTLMDARGAAVAGNPYYYYFSKGTGTGGSDSFAEGRYEQIDGSISATKVAPNTSPNGAWSVNRYESPMSLKPALSDRYPSVRSPGFSAGAVQAVMTFKDMKDGSNYATVTANADGSGSISYAKWAGTVGPYGITGVGAPSRTNSPTFVAWDSSGAITALSSPGKTITAPFTVAHYNEITGQSWDGSYLKASDIDLSVPFEPVAKF